MTTATVTGKTFDHRERLKQLGGRWDANAQSWKFDYATLSDIKQLKQLVGCMVTVKDDPFPMMPIIITADDDEPRHGNGKTVQYGDDMRYLNAFKDRNPVAFFGFSSLSAIAKFVDAIPEEKRVGARDAGWETDRPRWYGTRDMSEALDHARNGWLEGVQNAARVVDMINVEHAVTRRRTYAVAGGSVSIGRMLAGNPFHMVKRPKLPGRRVMTLFVQNTASASIDAKQLIARAAICAAIADVLERNGYSCEIVSVTTQAEHSDKPAAQTVVTVKQSGEKLNIADIAFALGHPSFLRRFNFACVSQADELRPIWSTQGYPRAAFDNDAQEIYIRHLKRNVEGDNLEEIARNMLPLIIPHNLPLEIEA